MGVHRGEARGQQPWTNRLEDRVEEVDLAGVDRAGSPELACLARSFPGDRCGQDLEVDLVATVGSMSEANLDQVVADLVRRGAVEEAHRSDVGVVGLLDDPHRPSAVLLGEVRDEPPEVVGISGPVLVLEADRDLLAVLVDGGGEYVEALAEDVVLGAHRRELFELQRIAQRVHALRQLQPRCEVGRLAAEDLPGREPLDWGDLGEASAHPAILSPVDKEELIRYCPNGPTHGS